MLIFLILISLLLCAALFWAFRTSRNSSDFREQAVRIQERLLLAEADRQRLESELKSTRAERDSAVTLNATLNEQVRHGAEDNARLQKQIQELKDSHNEEIKKAADLQKQLLQQSESNFRLMANDIMERHSATFRQQNEQRLGEILTPLKENIDKFRHDVAECYSAEARERFSLQEKIKDLIEANNNIGREAKELASALRGNSKKQGDWGEMVLESILEQSGLRRGEEFLVQQQTDDSGCALRDDDGRGLRPDVVVRYPGGRVMVIDSKVSLTAFVDYVNAEDRELQEQYGRLHLQSVLKHINELSAKKYQDYIGSEMLDFVMMFIPNEGAYAAAMTLDPTLWQKAYDKRVLMASPTQLVGALRLISQLWTQDRQTRNSLEIARRAGRMYEKFVGFVTDMERIDKSIESTRTAYENAMKKLRQGNGNLVSQAEKLRELGIKTEKRIPGSEDYSAE